MAGLQWARLQVNVNCQLRRGAWYRVIRLAPREVVLEVDRKPLPVPRPLLQLTSTRPRRWTVVPRPHNAVGLPPSWNDYAVCPSCGDRAPLERRPTSMRCLRCNGLFEIAWDEPYLATV